MPIVILDQENIVMNLRPMCEHSIGFILTTFYSHSTQDSRADLLYVAHYGAGRPFVAFLGLDSFLMTMGEGLDDGAGEAAGLCAVILCARRAMRRR